MTKQTEALKMAIELIERFLEHDNISSSDFIYAHNASIKALELTVAELNDEYLRDTHVEGLNKPRIALEKATKAWNDIDLTGQTNLECARNWFIEGYVQALEFPPKQWQGLSDEDRDEIWEGFFKQGISGVDWIVRFARAIEAKLREKNDG